LSVLAAALSWATSVIAEARWQLESDLASLTEGKGEAFESRSAAADAVAGRTACEIPPPTGGEN